MFQLELIELINKFRTSTDDYEKNKIIISISNLIKENKEEYQKFLDNPIYDFVNTNTMEILKIAESKIEINNEEKNNNNNNNNLPQNHKNINQEDTTEIVKNIYLNWEKQFEINNYKNNKECENIINSLVNKFAENQLDVLLKILEINDTQNFEIFKNMIKNHLRKYFILKIKTYRKSPEFEKKNFFEKRKRKKEIFKLYEELGKYKFNYNKIIGVLK